MKDIIGYLKRTIWIFNILIFVLFLFPSKIFAQPSLGTDAIFSHNVKDNKVVETTLTFTISSEVRTVLTYYTITIPQANIEPEIYSTNKGKKLEATIYNRTNSTDILVDFENQVITSEESARITLSYVQKYDNANILELYSKVADTTTSKVFVTYPKNWGKTNWVSDQIENIKESDNSYVLTINKPDSDIVNLIFGEDIIYSFNISRALNNPSDVSNQFELLIPQDTEFQKVIIDQISIQPTQTLIDNSGNYILIYTLDPNSQIDLKISGYILMQQHEYYSNDLKTIYDSNDLYWSLENRQIEDIEDYLVKHGIDDKNNKSNLIQYLYRYVVEELTPSTSATSLAGGPRRGASEVLQQPKDSTPEDYADVLRALCSYYEIPAIYTIGYVSDISSYQKDGMFHYWIQIYDNENWFILDPYLEDFSKVSLYGRPQLDHISILNRTNNSISPILTYYSDNDIKFEYIQDNTIKYEPESNVSISLEPYSILNKYLYGEINIENTGNTIFSAIELSDSQPDLNKYLDSVTTSVDNILLPHTNKSINFHIPFNDLTEEIIFSTVNIKNGVKNISSELISTEYSISERTGYELIIKSISFLLFVITFGIIYIVIDKIIYKK